MALCMYWNCGSGLVKKLSNLHSFIDSSEPVAVFVSECDVVNGRNINIFSHKGYNLAFSNTLTQTGKSRILAWYRDDLFERLPHLEMVGNEIIVLKSKEKNFLLVGCYRPFKLFPGETVISNFNRLMTNFELITNYSQNVVLIGDLNINLMTTSNDHLKLTLETWANQNMLFQLVEGYTRQRIVAGNLQMSLLDVVFSSISRVAVKTSYDHQSDHLQLHVTLPLTNRPKGNKTFFFTDWSHYSVELVQTLFLQNFNGINIHVHDPDLINNQITTAICDSLNILLPKRHATVRNSSQVFSPKILNLRNRKSRAYKRWTRSGTPESLLKLKEISIALSHEVKKIKQSKINAGLGKDNKSFWKTVNNMMGNSVTKNDSLLHETTEVVDPLAIANIFNDFFSSKVTDLAATSACENYIIPDLSSYEDTGISDFITEEELIESLSCLKSSKSQGFDEIPGIVLKHLAPVIIRPLLWLFNSIVSSGIIPQAWKVSRIVPIHKKGDKKLASNYRPVSNISSLSKVFERCVILKLKKIDTDTLFGSNQHAYRSGSSTSTACLTIQDFVAMNLDEKKIVLLYSIDLTSAFDLLRPSLLVKNLLELNVSKRLINVIYNFLSKRTGFVDFNGQNSFINKIPLGCVQGSVLGPILFNIYVRNLQKIVGENVMCVSYADDSYIAITSSINNINNSINNLSMIASNHINWLTDIGMKCNASKTEFIAFGYSGAPISLSVGGSIIEAKDQIKILGVTFSSDLSWSQHVQNTLTKCNRLSYLLRYLASFLTIKQHRRILHSHFFSILYYCSSVWAGCLKQHDARRLGALVFKTIRLNCRDFNNIFRNKDLCVMSDLRSFDSARTVNDALMLYALCTNPSNTLLTTRLIQQSLSFSRFPARIAFVDYSNRRIGRSSFINRSKRICESIPFDWLHLSARVFKAKLKNAIPLYLA